jgi:hypothetical protein
MRASSRARIVIDRRRSRATPSVSMDRRFETCDTAPRGTVACDHRRMSMRGGVSNDISTIDGVDGDGHATKVRHA